MWFVLNAVGVDLICIHYTYLMGGDGFVFVGYNTLGHGKIFAWNVDMLWAYYKTLRYYATSLKFAGSIPDDVIGIFHRHNPSAALWLWGRLNLYHKWVPGIFPGG